MGIEPTALAWEARVLPLYDARLKRHCRQDCRRWQIPRRGVLKSAIMIDISLNGQPHRLAAATSVAQLMAELGFTGKRVAVEKNGTIVPKSRHAQTPVGQGDRIEIVVAVGGG